MEYKNKIKNYLINTKKRFRGIAEVILKFISRKKSIDSYVNYKDEISNYNNYEKCRMEISMQRIRDRNLF